MILRPFHYLGTNITFADLGGLHLTQTYYDAYQTQPWHCHETPNFFFLLGGRFIDESQELGQATPASYSLVYHPAGARHRSFAGPAGRFGLNIEPTPDWLARFHLSESDLGQYRVQQDARACLTLLDLSLRFFSRQEAADATFEALLSESLTGAVPEVRESPVWFQRLERRLADEACRWTLATLSAEVGVHPVYLARVFRQRYGTSVTQHLHRLRLLHATSQMVSGMDLTQAALEAGFADHAHFARSFRKAFRRTPSQARFLLNKAACFPYPSSKDSMQ